MSFIEFTGMNQQEIKGWFQSCGVDSCLDTIFLGDSSLLKAEINEQEYVFAKGEKILFIDGKIYCQTKTSNDELSKLFVFFSGMAACGMVVSFVSLLMYVMYGLDMIWWIPGTFTVLFFVFYILFHKPISKFS